MAFRFQYHLSLVWQIELSKKAVGSPTLHALPIVEPDSPPTEKGVHVPSS